MWLALAAGLALGGTPVDTRLDEAARAQVRLWLDLGELGLADAASRRALAAHQRNESPDDTVIAWHLVRLDVLHAAGLGPWIEVEYGDRRHKVATAARDRWTPIDDPWTRDFLDDPEIEGRWDATRDPRALTELVRGWPEVRTLAWADAWTVPWEGRDRKAGAALQRAILDALGDPPDDPWGWTGAARTLLAIGAAAPGAPVADPLGRLADHVAGVQGTPDLQARMDDLARLPQAWLHWDIPRRPRLDPAAMTATARLLVQQHDPALPWGRPDERRVMATALADELDRLGRVDEADDVRRTWLGACAPTSVAARQLARAEATSAHLTLQDELTGCLGMLDLMPTDDVAGLDVTALLDRTAAAWSRYAAGTSRGGWPDEAAVAWNVAARLAPTEERVARARAAGMAAGLTVDPRTGLLPVDALIARLEVADWLRPAEALPRARAQRTVARTAALLDPSPARLAARVTPADACLPTMRSRCQVEAAVAATAFKDARQAPPADLPPVQDPAAWPAARRWREELGRVGFMRQAELQRLAGEAEVLTEVITPRSGVREGEPAPRWQVGAWSPETTAGRVVVLAYWATWCQPCLAELPVLDAAVGQWRADGIDLVAVAVNLDDADARMEAALAPLGLRHLDAVRAPGAEVALDIQALPTTVVIGPDGVVREIHSGWEPDALADTEAAVRR